MVTTNPEQTYQLDSRQRQMADAPVLPVLRTQRFLRLTLWASGLLCGLGVFFVLFSPVFALDLQRTIRPELLGNALLFGCSVAIVMGATGALPRHQHSP